VTTPESTQSNSALPTSKHLLRIADVKSGKGNILAVDAYEVTSVPDLRNFIRKPYYDRK
jgi:hypothetical protein